MYYVVHNGDNYFSMMYFDLDDAKEEVSENNCIEVFDKNGIHQESYEYNYELGDWVLKLE